VLQRDLEILVRRQKVVRELIVYLECVALNLRTESELIAHLERVDLNLRTENRPSFVCHVD
jgi:hypothetical protein